MMKQIFTLVLLFAGIVGHAQKDDDIIYYEDAQVKHSRFSISIYGNPNYTDRKLVNDDIPAADTTENSFQLANEDAEGSFQVNYGLDIYFSIGSSLDIGLGFGRSNIDYSVENATFFRNELDTSGYLANFSTHASMYTVPLKLNFNTSVSDIWDLEVVPMVQMNFIDTYESEVSPIDPAFEDFVINRDEDVEDITFSVGIALGGTYKFADNWGLILRGKIIYMLNPLIEMPNYPRETIYNYGIDVGLKYSF